VQTPHDQKKAVRRPRLHWSHFLHVEGISSLPRLSLPAGKAYSRPRHHVFRAAVAGGGTKKICTGLLIVRPSRPYETALALPDREC
jgi:hypothetical protein